LNPPDIDDNHATAISVAGSSDKAYMQEINDAWATLKPDNAAKYYEGSPRNKQGTK